MFVYDGRNKRTNNNIMWVKWWAKCVKQTKWMIANTDVCWCTRNKPKWKWYFHRTLSPNSTRIVNNLMPTKRIRSNKLLIWPLYMNNDWVNIKKWVCFAFMNVAKATEMGNFSVSFLVFVYILISNSIHEFVIDDNCVVKMNCFSFFFIRYCPKRSNTFRLFWNELSSVDFADGKASACTVFNVKMKSYVQKMFSYASKIW